MERNSFIFYKGWREAIKDLPDDVRLEIYESIIEYATTGNLRGLKPMANIAFNFIKIDIDRDTEKYMSIVERNKSNGSKGGRPKSENPKEPKEPTKPTGLFGNPKEPTKPDNDNEYDNDSDNEEYIHTPTKARACAHAEVGKPRKKSEPVKYSDDPELNDAIVEFIKFRKDIKKPMSDRAITLMMNKLESLSHDKHEQVQILNQSIMQGWTGLYALKDDGKSRGQPRNVNPNGFANFKQTDNTEQLGQLEKMLADELNK